MTLEELEKLLKEQGLSQDTIKALLSTYDLGYAQGLTDAQQTNQPHKDNTPC